MTYCAWPTACFTLQTACRIDFCKACNYIPASASYLQMSIFISMISYNNNTWNKRYFKRKENVWGRTKKTPEWLMWLPKATKRKKKHMRKEKSDICDPMFLKCLRLKSEFWFFHNIYAVKVGPSWFTHEELFIMMIIIISTTFLIWVKCLVSIVSALPSSLWWFLCELNFSTSCF